jgi:uncharacterized membrane protein YuzA (DUF378 family)
MRLKLTEKDRDLLAIAPPAIQWIIFGLLLFALVDELSGGGPLGALFATIALTVASVINLWYLDKYGKKGR